MTLSVAACVVCVLAASDGIAGRGSHTHEGLANAARYQAARFETPDAARARVAADLQRVLAASDDDARRETLGALADDTGREHVGGDRLRAASAAIAVAATIAAASERDPEAAVTAVLDRYAATPIASR